MNNSVDPQDQREWENGFDGHARAQLLRLARLTFEQKLRWLDEMHRLLFGAPPASDP